MNGYIDILNSKVKRNADEIATPYGIPKRRIESLKIIRQAIAITPPKNAVKNKKKASDESDNPRESTAINFTSPPPITSKKNKKYPTNSILSAAVKLGNACWVTAKDKIIINNSNRLLWDIIRKRTS
ncbi:hypothetical protein SOASR015_15060 [Pectobacterium carotovorum subsp. carotovorum]|nr:hypothetical protein SOASR015_15060 [Pectobacterium carotovorum subsp. carotovorum]GLX55347.1 hypothetical protein Pcaca02_06560 [Pectobacterium carotovorum subsp. carotovorum]